LKLTWRNFKDTLPIKTEAEVLEMLAAEQDGQRRVEVLVRLHQRYNVLRVTRERLELIKESK